jgi:hypothetical protein
VEKPSEVVGMTGFWLVMQAFVTLVTVASYLLAGNKKASGWLLTIGANAVWVIYALGTRQYFLCLGCVLLTIVCIRNWKLWTDEKDYITIGGGIATRKLLEYQLDLQSSDKLSLFDLMNMYEKQQIKRPKKIA